MSTSLHVDFPFVSSTAAVHQNWLYYQRMTDGRYFRFRLPELGRAAVASVELVGLQRAIAKFPVSPERLRACRFLGDGQRLWWACRSSSSDKDSLAYLLEVRGTDTTGHSAVISLRPARLPPPPEMAETPSPTPPKAVESAANPLLDLVLSGDSVCRSKFGAWRTPTELDCVRLKPAGQQKLARSGAAAGRCAAPHGAVFDAARQQLFHWCGSRVTVLTP